MTSRLVPIAEIYPKIESALENILKWREDRYQKELAKTIRSVEAKRRRMVKLSLGLYKFRECTIEEADKILDTQDSWVPSWKHINFNWKQCEIESDLKGLRSLCDVANLEDKISLSVSDARIIENWS